MRRPAACLCCVMPPHILHRLARHDSPHVRRAAERTLAATAVLRAGRHERHEAVGTDARRTVLDMRNGRSYLAAVPARAEHGRPVADEAANRAYDGLGTTLRFYRDVFGRNSLDNQGMALRGYVHFGTHYTNAVWTGQVMIFGDGDGRMFGDFTRSLDVIAHELAHGVTAHTAGLEYRGQSGALSESISDVFGSLVKQWSRGQSAAEADWLIGAEVFTPRIKADAIRSLKTPGHAYDNALLGKDPQVAHMRHYRTMPETEDGDFGGVHVNSGIPNKAFYLLATHLGGHAWEVAGRIWYEALLVCGRQSDFQFFADATFMKAEQLFGNDSLAQKAVLDAWGRVGIRVRISPAERVRRRAR